MLGETKNQFSLTRAALSTGGRAKSNFLSVKSNFLSVTRLSSGSRSSVLLSRSRLLITG